MTILRRPHIGPVFLKNSRDPLSTPVSTFGDEIWIYHRKQWWINVFRTWYKQTLLYTTCWWSNNYQYRVLESSIRQVSVTIYQRDFTGCVVLIRFPISIPRLWVLITVFWLTKRGFEFCSLPTNKCMKMVVRVSHLTTFWRQRFSSRKSLFTCCTVGSLSLVGTISWARNLLPPLLLKIKIRR